MRLSPPSLLLVTVLATVAACKLDSSGLAPGQMMVVVPDAGAAGSGVISGAAGATSLAGAGGGAVAGGSGGSSTGGGTGTAGNPGSAGDGGGGMAGSGTAGGGGDTGTSGAGQAGADGTPDAGGEAGSTVPPPDAHPISIAGCADGTREGLIQLAKFPDVAACSGGWTVPGFLAPETLTPQCGRAAGNDGDRPDGDGCSVADLCAEGWHVCESAHEFAAKATNCDLAFPGGAVKMFFATRQRGPMTTCDPTNEMGTNNVYGCGNFGSTAMTACAPFMHMLRDYDCKANPPWMCMDGPINYNVNELGDMTKPGSDHGGVLCCR
jgi:hypothetical protein